MQHAAGTAGRSTFGSHLRPPHPLPLQCGHLRTVVHRQVQGVPGEVQPGEVVLTSLGPPPDSMLTLRMHRLVCCNSTDCPSHRPLPLLQFKNLNAGGAVAARGDAGRRPLVPGCFVPIGVTCATPIRRGRATNGHDPCISLRPSAPKACPSYQLPWRL